MTAETWHAIAAAEGASTAHILLAFDGRHCLRNRKSDELRQVKKKYILAMAGSPLSGCFGDAHDRRMHL
jgi:hypothetical protein